MPFESDWEPEFEISAYRLTKEQVKEFLNRLEKLAHKCKTDLSISHEILTDMEIDEEDQEERRRETAIPPRNLAEHRHRAAQFGRLPRLLLCLPFTARLLAAPRPAARELRQMPLGAGSSAEGDLRRVQARSRLP